MYRIQIYTLNVHALSHKKTTAMKIKTQRRNYYEIIFVKIYTSFYYKNNFGNLAESGRWNPTNFLLKFYPFA